MEKRKPFLASTHLFLIKWNEILLYLRKWWSQDWLYNLIAWHLDWWETPRESTVREAIEEAWIIININNLKFCNITHSITWTWTEYMQFYFSCDKWKWEIKNLEKDRCYEMKFFPLNNLPKNITPYIKDAINNYKNQIIYSEYK